jgi:hypothetical protein
VDIDGSFTYSDIVAVNCKGEHEVTVFPNPANTFITVNFYQQEKGIADLKIFYITGQVVLKAHPDVEKGFNSFTLNIDDLIKGVYYLKLETDSHDSYLFFISIFVRIEC